MKKVILLSLNFFVIFLLVVISESLWLRYNEVDGKYIRDHLALQSCRQYIKIDRKIIAELNGFIDGIDYKKAQTTAKEEKLQTWIWKHTIVGEKDLSKLLAHLAVNARYGVYVLAIMFRESSFNPRAHSKVAYGLGQIKYTVWNKELKQAKIITCKKDLYNPIKNFWATHYILTKYIQQTKTLSEALKKYRGKKHTAYVINILNSVAEIAR